MKVRIGKLPQPSLAAARALLKVACEYDEAALVAEEKLFFPGALGRPAEPLGAYLGDQLIGLACTSQRWLRLLAVHPGHRGKGCGSALLLACEKQIKSHASSASLMDQPGNYLSPGIDERNQDSIRWLTKRGFAHSGEANNLRIELASNPLISQSRYREQESALRAQGYQLARLAAHQLDATAAMVEKEFSKGWAFEMTRAASASEPGVHLATELSSGTVVAFAAHDGNNQGLGWFGPTGTLEPHRGRGIGAALLVACLLDVQASGLGEAQIAWIGPRDFYDKIVGIKSERRFILMNKELQ